MVGVVNTATFYGFYLALHPLMPYFLAYTAAFVLSMIGSFFLNTYFTYRTRPTWRKFLLFPLTNLTNYVVTSVGVYVFVEWAHMNDKIAPLVAAAAAIPFTYVLSRRILTRGARQDADASEGAEGAQVAEDTEAGPADGTAAGPAAPQQHPQDLAPVTRP
ncbi:GtrA family protein [Actinacidiphila rubida]|nr:GtrA family protein [Actinacidiphila rubida]